MQQNLFITGIGTGIGKTVCSAILTQYFNADYWKPIQSGDLHSTDTMTIQDLSDHQVTCYPETYRLKQAASPHQSASEEGVSISLNNFKIPETSHPLIIEGAGGLMVPLSDEKLIIDLIAHLTIPTALVVKDYLGCINHTLLSVSALRQRNIPLDYLVLNGDFNPDTERVICKHLPWETKIIRVPEIKTMTAKQFKTIVNNLKINENEYIY
ncbi:dethiobiotin synthase [Chryseobacterium sp.]|uniref:dethiobiotin synthase n=1 Tax=Chryseobacterium sp. TaxID=1871047 RepID=UPI0025BAB8EE|nr:dethiobiotin synthase [Chryseobacterium sp.]